MGDEDRTRELPQRVQGAARAGPAPPRPPALSEELRQRIQAAVRAERGEAAGQDHGQDQEFTSKPERRVTASGSARGDVSSQAGNSVNRAIDSERTAELAAPERTIEPVKPVKREPADHAPADHEPVAVLRADQSARTHAGARKKPARRRFVRSGLVASALIVIAAAALGIAVARYITGWVAEIHASNVAQQRQEVAVRQQAAAWVAQQVSRADTVSCDPVMCAALAAAGFPKRQLLALTSTSSYPKTSAVVVETPAVLGLFGTSLNNYAPAVLATFGSADSQVTVRVIWPSGATAYYEKLSADRACRKSVGNDLLQVSGITFSPTARQQLAVGQPASRLLLAIASLASNSNQPIDIVQFGNTGPGADPDIPLRFADLAESDPASHLASSAYIRSIHAALRKIPIQLYPASIETVDLGGQAVLRIGFLAPSPLGLVCATSISP
jgi:hypothetical protein